MRWWTVLLFRFAKYLLKCLAIADGVRSVVDVFLYCRPNFLVIIFFSIRLNIPIFILNLNNVRQSILYLAWYR